MWFALRLNSLFAIIGATVGLVMVAPMGLIYLLPLLVGGLAFNPIILAALAAPVLLGTNLCFIFWASRQLRRELRAKERSFVDRLFSWIAASSSAKLLVTETQSAQ
jgi:hypothetical protein